MKIISWNVNGIRAVERKKDLQNFLQKENPDIFCLQEIKGNSPDFSEFLVNNQDYQTFYNSAEKKGYAGTGIWVKKSFAQNLENLEFKTNMDNWEDKEGRISRISFLLSGKKYEIFSVYFPNGGKSPEAWTEKLEFYETFLQFVNKLRKENSIIIWGGDVNCAHTEIDLARPKDNKNSIGFLPAERAWISKCLSENWVDVFREKYPQKIIYSWWHVISRARLRNVGWRIDYWFCDKKIFPFIKNIEYLNNQMGSDHCPVSLEILKI